MFKIVFPVKFLARQQKTAIFYSKNGAKWSSRQFAPFLQRRKIAKVDNCQNRKLHPKARRKRKIEEFSGWVFFRLRKFFQGSILNENFAYQSCRGGFEEHFEPLTWCFIFILRCSRSIQSWTSLVRVSKYRRLKNSKNGLFAHKQSFQAVVFGQYLDEFWMKLYRVICRSIALDEI